MDTLYLAFHHNRFIRPWPWRYVDYRMYPYRRLVARGVRLVVHHAEELGQQVQVAPRLSDRSQSTAQVSRSFGLGK